MSEVASILWPVFALAMLGCGMYVLYHPPRTLLRLKHKDSELQIQTAPKEVTPVAVEVIAEKGSPAEPAESSPETSPTALEVSRFAQAFSLMKAGSYIEGMELIREEASEELQADLRPGYIALGQYIAVTMGTIAALEDLYAHAEKYPQDARVLYWVGMALKSRKDTVGAEQYFRRSSEHAIADDQRADAIKAIAAIRIAAGDVEEAILLLVDAIEDVSDRMAASDLFAELARAYKARKPADLFKAFACYERALELHPTNDSLEFEVAYAYSEAGADAQALHLYSRLIAREPAYHSAANNAGVSAGAVSLPITQIKYYRQGEALGETLPMANIAQKFIAAGFLPEARGVIDEALKAPDPHRNVLEAMGDLAQAQRTEEGKLQRIMEKTGAISRWRSRIAIALHSSVPREHLIGSFSDDTTRVDVNEDGTFTGTLSKDDKEFSLNGSFIGSVGEFSWTAASRPGNYLFPLLAGSGTGVMVHEGDVLLGYRISGSKTLDPANSSDFHEFKLRRKTSAHLLSPASVE